MRYVKTVSMLLTLGSVAACGGGSAGPTVPTVSLTIKGTSAKGAALAGATVTAKCSGGTGSATTAADGSYTIALSSGSLPCVLKASTASGDFYSVAAGSGTTVTANITPVTQLIVANLTGKDPAAYYAGFGAGDAAALTSVAVDAAQAAVATVLNNNGVDSTAAGNPLSGTLVASNGSTTGNALDQVLDALAGKLTSAGVTLAQLTTTVQQTAAPGTSTVPSGTPAVAVDVALQPRATSCAALRSGIYRIVVPQVGAAGSFGNESTERITIDATVPRVTFSDNTSDTLTPMAGSPCRFTAAAGSVDIVVSQAGVLVFKSTDVRSGVGFPEQTLGLADLAGDWNWLGYDRSDLNQPLTPTAATGTISSAGVLTLTTWCNEAKTCAAVNSNNTVPITVNAGGGFDVNFSATDKSRLFAYRAGGGEVVLVAAASDGTHAILTRVRTLTLPAVNDVNVGWGTGTTNSLLNGNYSPSGFDVSEYSNTVTAVDSANSAFTRSNVINFTGQVTRPEAFTSNKVAGTARNGYFYRTPQTVTSSAGASSVVREAIFLPLRGMGITVSAFPAPSAQQASTTSYQYSVAKP